MPLLYFLIFIHNISHLSVLVCVWGGEGGSTLSLVKICTIMHKCDIVVTSLDIANLTAHQMALEVIVCQSHLVSDVVKPLTPELKLGAN